MAIRPFDQSERNRAKERKEANMRKPAFSHPDPDGYPHKEARHLRRNKHKEADMTPTPENYPYPLTMNDYQADAAATMIYKLRVIYPALGLASEAGEVCDKIKKLIRDHGFKFDGSDHIRGAELTDKQRADIIFELGDVLWYVAALSRDLGVSLNELAHMNLEKLKLRQERNKISGSGDNR